MKKLYTLIVILLYGFCSYSYPIKVKTSQVIIKDFSKEIVVPAECKSYYSRDYIASASGIIDFIEENKSYFKKGDLIIAIDKELSQSTKDEAYSNYKSNQISYERDKTLYSKKIISEEKLEQSKLQFFSAKAKLEIAKKDFENKIIYAPFDGEVSIAKFKVGDGVSSGDFLFNITSGDKKFISFTIPEKYKINQNDFKAMVSYDGKDYDVTSVKISKTISNDKMGYIGTGLIEKDNELEHNSYVSLKIRYSKHSALAIPEGALVIKDGKNSIYILGKDNKVKLVPLELGDRNDGFIEIRSKNIDLDQKFVTEGIQKLSDGQEVKVIE